MTGRVVGLFRYPVKGLSAEGLHEVGLVAGQAFPGDRAFALALPDTPFDPAEPVAFRKTGFLMLARDEALASLRTTFDEAEGRMTVRGEGESLDEDVGTPDGRARIEAFFARFQPGGVEAGSPRLVAARGHRFTDVGVHGGDLMEAISVVNLATVRDLSRRLGVELDVRRFRANVVIDGPPAWSELEWLDRDLDLGEVRTRCVRRTRRCAATEVNPETAARDVNVPRGIMKEFGHIDLGVYLSVRTDGHLRIDDEVR